MASLASVISLIVLLAAYGYSLPVEDQFPSSTYPTSSYEFTTGTTIVDNTDRITAHLMNNEESASVPTIKIPREYLDKYSYAYTTTPAQSESHEHDSRESRMIDDMFFSSSPFTAEFSSSDLPPRGLDEHDFLETTTFLTYNSAEEETFKPKFTKPKQTKRTFDSKESVMDKSTSAEVFSTTPVFEHGSKESTSAESFGKFSGSRGNIRTQESSTKMSSGMKYPSTSESRETDRSSEESKFRGPTKPTSFVPIKGQKQNNF
jgi:hypothetical protein